MQQWLQYGRLTREQAQNLMIDTIMPGVDRLTAGVASA